MQRILWAHPARCFVRFAAQPEDSRIRLSLPRRPNGQHSRVAPTWASPLALGWPIPKAHLNWDSRLLVSDTVTVDVLFTGSMLHENAERSINWAR